MIRIALVTADAALPLDEDMPPLSMRCARRRRVATPRGRCRGRAGYDIVPLRSTWDYVDRIDEFSRGRGDARYHVAEPAGSWHGTWTNTISLRWARQASMSCRHASSSRAIAHELR
jgi:hypothetical protein